MNRKFFGMAQNQILLFLITRGQGVFRLRVEQGRKK
ncbi:hypothetical protein PRO82_000232 [Candidatus Protochlamydia amoebophila]|nr:hypothetical protein [Candidatus Protochlamydia amoebophila]